VGWSREKFGMMSPVTGGGGVKSSEEREVSTLLLVFRLSFEEEMALATTLETLMSKERDGQKCRSKVTKWVRKWNG
jgi:hypothetical protein